MQFAVDAVSLIWGSEIQRNQERLLVWSRVHHPRGHILTPLQKVLVNNVHLRCAWAPGKPEGKALRVQDVQLTPAIALIPPITGEKNPAIVIRIILNVDCHSPYWVNFSSTRVGTI